MGYNGLIRVVEEQRRFNRIVCRRPVTYRYAPGYNGKAVCLDAGLGGLRVRLGRYLRPGTHLLVTFPDRTPEDEPLQLKARVAWCRGADNHHFAAGLRVYDDEPDASTSLAQLVARTVTDAGGGVGLWSTPMPKVVMG